MDALLALLASIGAVASCAAGLATILGLHGLRERLLRTVVAIVMGSALVPMAAAVVTRALRGTAFKPVPLASAGLWVLVLGGHLALAAFMLQRRLRRRDAHRDPRQEVERIRARGRARLSSEGEEL